MATMKEKIVSSPGKKQPTVRSIGVRYTFPYDVYPRYSYLRSWTARLVPRFRQKIETNSLQECVCNGYEGLEEIIKAEKCLQKPSVTLFWKTRPPSSDFQRSLVSTLEPFKYDKLLTCGMAWNDLVNEGIGSSEFDSRVLIIIAKDTDKDIAQKLSNLTQAQQESTLIYNPSTKSHHFHKKEKEDTSRSLCQDIQALLELKVVTLLEKIAFYMEPLVPRDGPEPDKSLLDHIKDQLKQFERCCVKEILEEGKTAYNSKDVQGRTPEAENKRRKKAVNEKQGPRKNPSDQLFSEKLEKGQKDKLIKLIGRRTKCHIVEHLSMEYGIHPMVLTSLLCSEKFYNFDSHYDSWISKHDIDELYTAETILSESEAKIKYLVQDVSHYVSNQNEHLEGIQKQEFELYGLLRQSDPNVKVKLETKLNPEMQNEILCLPEVTGCGTIYGILTLHTSEELSLSTKDILRNILHEYNYYRRYRVTVVSSRVDQVWDGIEIDGGSGLLAERLYTSEKKQGTIGCFVFVNKKASRSETKVTPEDLGDQDLTEVGKKSIREQVYCESEIIYDRITKNASSLRRESEEKSDPNGLHCITCQHCVRGCEREVEFKKVNGEVGKFAVQTPYFIESGDKFDIALLKVSENRKNACKLKLPRKCELNEAGYVRYPWRICTSQTLEARPVYKYGSKSKDTYGVIASDDYMQAIKNALQLQKPDRYTDEERCMHQTVNLIIIGSDGSRFSEEGDSGSIICDEDINDSVVTAISILHGEITKESGWSCTYSARLRDSFDELERRFGIEIQQPTFSLSMDIESPFSPIPDLFDLPQSPEGDIDEQMADQGDMDEPMADQGDTDEPMADQGDTDEPMADQGDTDEPMADQGDTDEPMADQGDTDGLMADQVDMDEPMADQGDMIEQNNITGRPEQMRQEEVDQHRYEMNIGEGAVGGVGEESKEQANVAKTCKSGKAHFKSNGLCVKAGNRGKVCLQRQQQSSQYHISPLNSRK